MKPDYSARKRGLPIIPFVSVSKNMRNKRTNHLIEYNGETKCIVEWCEELNIHPSTLWRRLNSGWAINEAFTKPIQKHKRMDGDSK